MITSKFEKICVLTLKNSDNLNIYQIIEISLVLHNAYIIFKNLDEFIFYVNNYINLDQFNYLYNLDWINKNIENVDIVVYKLNLTLIRVINYKLEIIIKKRQKREKLVKKQKTKAMAIKC